MRIQELHIERFGIWQQVRLALDPRGLTVLYGPNETGKSTLMRFIRGVLYGFPQQQTVPGATARSSPIGGGLTIEHDGAAYRLHRVAAEGERGRLEINGRAVPADDPLLVRLMGGTSEAVFENVFAIGLHELQQLASLNGDEVARHIYGLSLGLEGQRILKALEGCESHCRDWLSPDQRTGELVATLQQLEEVDRQLARLPKAEERYRAAMEQLRRTELEIESLTRQQHLLRDNLRGQQFLERVWGPWSRQQELNSQLSQLRVNERITPQVLERFDDLESELAEELQRQQALREESARLLKQARGIDLRPEFEEHSCDIRRLVQRSTDIRSLQQSTPGGQQPSPAASAEMRQLLAALPQGWDIERLRGANLSPQWLAQLTIAGVRLTQARARWTRRVKQLRLVGQRLQQKQRHWEAAAARWGKESPAEIRRQAERRIRELEELKELRYRRDQLQQTQQILGDGTPPPADRLPPLFRLVLSFFTVAGLGLVAAGLYVAVRGDSLGTGRLAAWVAGACLFLQGISAWAIGRVLKQQTLPGDAGVGDLPAVRARVSRELDRVEQSLDRLIRADALRPPLAEAVPRAGEPHSLCEREVVSHIQHELSRLDAYEQAGRAVDRWRKRASKLRLSLPKEKQALQARLREWGEVLDVGGFDGSLPMEEALETARRLFEIRHALAEYESPMHSTHRREQIDEFHREVQQLAQQLKERIPALQEMHDAVAEWERELAQQRALRRQRKDLRRKAHDLRRQAEQQLRRIGKLRRQRSALLAKCGAESRAEIVAKLQTHERRHELERQRHQTMQEIERIAQSEPNLAVVEEDLLAFHPEQFAIEVERLQSELAEVEQRLRAAHEQLGRQKEKLQEIEHDVSAADLHLERRQLIDALEKGVAQWSAHRLAADVMGRLRERVERTRQPQLLQDAAAHLQELTCGRYVNIWTRLGERKLLIDDDRQQSLGVEHLSSGTREQVFLAIRMAMIRRLAAAGTELPMVLDDVTVNFDQPRTEAALSLLTELARGGQQILVFTCHQHLAEMFRQRGIEPVWLEQLRAASAPATLRRPA